MANEPRIDDLLATYVAAVEQELARRASSRYWETVGQLSERVRKALLAVPRHRLLEGFYRWEEGRLPTWVPLDPDAPGHEDLEQAYALTPIVIKVSPEGWAVSSSSEPVLVGIMLELLRLEPGLNVLEIGTGTGYNAALLAEIVGDQMRITTLEIQADIAEGTRHLLRQARYGNIQLHCADGFYGWPKSAPYDRIVATTCCSDVSPHWRDQLSEEGWILVPLMHGGVGVAPLTQVFADGRGRVLSLAGFIPGTGMLGGSEPWVEAPVPSSFPLARELPSQRLTRIGGRSSEERSSFLSHYHYFLALSESKACLLGKPGLWQVLWDDRVGASAFLFSDDDGWMRVAGDEKLCRHVVENYEEYKELGEPLVRDYRMEFVVHPCPLHENENAPRVARLGPREWIIERRFTTQRVWLPG